MSKPAELKSPSLGCLLVIFLLTMFYSERIPFVSLHHSTADLFVWVKGSDNIGQGFCVSQHRETQNLWPVLSKTFTETNKFAMEWRRETMHYINLVFAVWQVLLKTLVKS